MRSSWLGMLACLVATRAFAGEDEAACKASYVAGQKEYKLEHNLLRGREELLVCARTCPDELRASCGKWLEEIARELPSIVVVAKDAHGRERADVTIDVDGAPAAWVAGRAIDVNPGAHAIRVHAGDRAIDERVVVNAGEKLKTVDVWTAPRIVEITRVKRPVPLGAYVLLGLGAASLVSFVTFGVWTSVENAQSNGCSPSCDPAARDDAFRVKTVVADVSLGVASAALVGALVVYLTRPKLVEHARTAVAASPRGLSVAGEF